MPRSYTLLSLLLCCAAVAGAQCLPSGRSTFASGLEALNRGDLSAAAASFETLVGAQPDCAEARNNLAVVLVEQGRLDEAAEQLRRAVLLRPDYQRARFNLQRVETIRSSSGTARLAQEPALPAAASPPTPRADTAAAAVNPPPEQEEPPPPKPIALQPPAIAALEPEGATAGVIEPGRKRVCLFTRTADGIRAGTCFPMASLEVQSWPQWLIAGDLGGQRIRLLDEAGQKRLKIIPEHAGVAGDVVRMRQADFDALAAQLVPWRSALVVLQSAAPPDGAGAAVAAVREALEHWRVAWEQKQLDAYTASYGASFAPQSEPDATHWRARKQLLFAHSGAISVDIAPPSVFVVDGGASVITVFEQRYRAGAAAAHDLKALRWRRDGQRWKIAAETVLRQNPPAPKLPPGAG